MEETRKKPDGAIRRVRLTFTEEVLGSTSNDPELFENFMRQRKVDALMKDGMDEADALKAVSEGKSPRKKFEESEEGEEEAGAVIDGEEASTDYAGDPKMTVFPRDEKGRPFIWNYQIKGAFKDAAGALMRVSSSKTKKGLKAYKKVIDGTIFVQERRIPYRMPKGSQVGTCQRPLRAQTPQGERVALACSETVPAGSTIEFTVVSLEPKNWSYIEEWLNYLQLRGIGQWRNSGKGSCLWEYAEEQPNR